MSVKIPKDPRSTQRKRARAALLESDRPYWCENCGVSPTDEDAPGGLYPAVTLQADHKSKNIMDNDLVNLQWLCPSCHRDSDNKTAKGVNPIADEFGYYLDLPTD